MKKCLTFIIVCLAMLFLSNSISAVPLDLSTFSADVGVAESGGVVAFTEDLDYSAIYFYNDAFSVASNAGILSFDYSLTVAAENDDYLVVCINYYDYFMEIGGYNSSASDPLTFSGSYNIDLSSYQGDTISLAFGLEANDEFADSFATVSNIDLATGSNAVPEPGTIILLGLGFICLLGAKRRRIPFI